MDHKWLGSIGNGKSEIVISDVQNEFKIVNKISFGLFDRKWDTILSSTKIQMDVLSKNLISFYSEKLTFRFINFGKSRTSAFNFLEQNNFSKFDLKPCEKKDLLYTNSENNVNPVVRGSSSDGESEDGVFLIVNLLGNFSSKWNEIPHRI